MMNPFFIFWSLFDMVFLIIGCYDRINESKGGHIMNRNQTIVLKNKDLEVTILTYGASIFDIRYNHEGNMRQVLSTSKDIETFLKDDLNKGRLIGRTAGKTFYEVVKEDACYHEVTTDFSHGGKSGFNKQFFDVLSVKEDEVTLGFLELEKDGFYQGDFEVKVTYKLDGSRLIIIVEGHSTKDTYANITTHPYFNLSGEKDIMNHHLMVPSKTHVRRSNEYKTGKRFDVKRGFDDFREEMCLKDTLKNEVLDHVYEVKENSIQATLRAGGIKLSVSSSYPAIVIFSQNRDSIYPLSNNHTLNNLHGGLAIEPQYVQAAVPLLKKGDRYHHEMTFHFESI